MKLAKPVLLTVFQRHVLEMLMKHPDVGPAFLSAMVWPDREVALRKGAAPGTGLVRPMLATLAKLKKLGLVDWWAPPSNATRGQRVGGSSPAVWKLTAAGRTALR